MLELIDESAPVFIAVVFAFALIIGSFLNVVIHRLPIMMEREWREQATNWPRRPSDEGCQRAIRPDRAALPLPVLRGTHHGLAEYSGAQLICPAAAGAPTARQVISARYPLVEL